MDIKSDGDTTVKGSVVGGDNQSVEVHPLDIAPLFLALTHLTEQLSALVVRLDVHDRKLNSHDIRLNRISEILFKGINILTESVDDVLSEVAAGNELAKAHLIQAIQSIKSKPDKKQREKLELPRD